MTGQTGEPQEEQGPLEKPSGGWPSLADIARRSFREGWEEALKRVEAAAEYEPGDEPADVPLPFLLSVMPSLALPVQPDATEQMNLVGEEVDTYRVTTELVTPKGRERRGLLIGIGVAFCLLFFIQVGFGLMLNADSWARVGPILSSFSTIVAGLLGVAGGFYFSGQD